jgi:chemotaxis protein methyltransferase WspC
VPHKRIEQLLRERIGLHAESIGASGVQVAVRARMSACGARSQQAYVEVLSGDPEEVSRLIDEVVVRETWFFREPAAFALLCERCTTPRAPGRLLRVLSLPCATGEEPYSIAISLLHAGVPPGELEVHGVDVSRKSLELATRALYTNNSLRSPIIGYEHYFERNAGGLSVIAAVRERVRFQEGNLLDPQLFCGVQFDAVFCRNLLIYFDRDARNAALANVHRLLREDGLVFAGHSEALQFSEAGFRGVGEPGCFAFERPRPERPRAQTPAKAASPKARSPVQAGPLASQKPRGGAASVARRTSNKPAARRSKRAPSLRPTASLDDARKLADRGELAAAHAVCESHLALRGPSAAAFCLLGVIKQASGDPRGARESFDKALYMDASHYEALSHIALLCEHAGDAKGAGYWRRRAERARIEQEGSPLANEETP